MGNFARAVLTVEDLSLIVGNAVSGINAMHGATERGELGKSYLCRNWDEYTRQLGGLLDPTVSLFPMYCKRVLDGGGVVRVSRSMHYTDPTDIATATSTKATASNAGVVNFEGQVVFVDYANKQVTLSGDYTQFLGIGDAITLELPEAGGSTPTTTTAVVAQGNFTVVTVALVSLTPSEIVVNGSVKWTQNFAGDLALQAKDYGDFANGKLWFEIKDPVSGTANKVDIFVGLDGYPTLNEEFRDVSDTPTVAELAALTGSSDWVNFLTNTLTLVPIPKTYFTSGTYDVATINALDIIGDVSAKTGVHSFDAQSDFVRLSVPEYTQNAIDNALVAYCSDRQDCIPFLRVPVGLTALGSIDYRNAEGLYAGGITLDTWEAVMVMNDIEITEEYTGDRQFITSLPDVLARATVKDNRDGSWGSFSGIQNEVGAGVIPRTFGVGEDRNLGAPARILDAQAVTAAGLIPIIDKETRRFGKATMVWGNSTMQLAQNTLLKFAHVAELMVHIRRVIKPIVEEHLFLPNDVTSWKNLHRAISLLMRGLVSNRAIDDFEYIGDQNVDRITDAVFNQQADIQNGIYKFRIKIVPITKMEVIEATFTVTNSLIGVEVQAA